MPSALKKKPELPAHLSFVWRAFFELTGDRQMGMGIGPIPFLAIDRYASRYGMDDPDQFERFSLLLRAMDSTYLRHVKAKTPTKQK